MSKFMRLCCCLTIAASFISKVSPAQDIAQEPDPLALNDETDSVTELPIPTGVPETDTGAATLRVLVEDGATIFINRYETVTQKRSGGTRLFTLTKLKPGAKIKTVIEAHFTDGRILQALPFDIEPAKSYEANFLSYSGGAAAKVAEITPSLGLPIQRLHQEVAKLSATASKLEGGAANFSKLTPSLDSFKAQVNSSVDSLGAAKDAIDAAKKELSEELKAANEKLAEATKQNQTSEKAVTDSASALEMMLKTSADSLSTSAGQLAKANKTATDKIESLIDKLEKAVEAATSDPSGDRIYKLEAESKIQATLTYNDALEISGIQFVASSLPETINFVDGNDWKTPEIASTGVLRLELQIHFGTATKKPFIPLERYSETIKFDSLEKDRTAKIRFASQAVPNLKKWVEETVVKNKDQAEKFGLDHKVSGLSLTGEFTLGSAAPMPVTQPLIITILK